MVLAHLTFILSLGCLKISDFLITLLQFLHVDLVLALLDCEVVEHPTVARIQVSVLGVHLVELRFKLESESHFFFVILVVLVEVLL